MSEIGQRESTLEALSEVIRQKIIVSDNRPEVKKILLDTRRAVADSVESAMVWPDLIDFDDDDSIEVMEFKLAIYNNPMIIADIHIGMGEYFFNLLSTDKNLRMKANIKRVEEGGETGIMLSIFKSLQKQNQITC